MKRHALWAGILLLALAASAGAARSSRARLQVVYRGDAAGHWQVFLFGLDSCRQPLTIQQSADATQPVEIRCGK